MEDIPYEKRLVPHIIDLRTKNTPDRVYAVLPKGSTFEDGFRDLTYSSLARAVDAAAYWLDEVLGGKGEDETLPYIGPDDFRYILLMFASYKSRRQFMVPLTMNTTEGLAKLLETRKCKYVLSAKSHAGHWDAPLAMLDGIKSIEIPELDFFLESHAKPYLYDRPYHLAMRDTLMIIQTSGTTGTPKPIVHDARSLLSNHDFWMESQCGPPNQHIAFTELMRDCYLPILLPVSWGATLAVSSSLALVFGLVPIFMPSAPHPMTAEYAHQATLLSPRGKRNCAMFSPFMLRELITQPERLDALKRYDCVFYAGAPLDQATGDAITKITRVQSLLGATDISGFPLLLDDPRDWNIHRFHTMQGFHFQHYLDDLYELCIRRIPDEFRHCFLTNPDPDLQVYHSRDLYKTVPGRPDFYTHAGRIDDFVKLASMTKFNAVNVERLIDGHPDVAGSLVAGDARTKSFVIIQASAALYARNLGRGEVLDRIWPAIEEANKTIFGDAKIEREQVIVADKNKPIRRTGKGTVDRRNTLKAYEEEIDALYQT